MADNSTGNSRRRILRRRAEQDTKDLSPEINPEDRSLTAGKGRATPSRRQMEEADTDRGNFFTRTIRTLAEYFEGVRSEIAKVAWPTPGETRRLTIIVIVTLIICAIVLGAISAAFTQLFNTGLDSPVILLAVMAVGIVGGFFINRLLTRSDAPEY